jgi:hypothetical protein
MRTMIWRKTNTVAFQKRKQVNDRQVFDPVNASKLNVHEKRKAFESLVFLGEKKDSRFKGKTCNNGSKQRQYVDRDQAKSPTVSTKPVLFTASI